MKHFNIYEHYCTKAINVNATQGYTFSGTFNSLMYRAKHCSLIRGVSLEVIK